MSHQVGDVRPAGADTMFYVFGIIWILVLAGVLVCAFELLKRGARHL